MCVVVTLYSVCGHFVQCVWLSLCTVCGGHSVQCVMVTLYSVCGGHSVQCVLLSLCTVCGGHSVQCVCVNVHVVMLACSNGLHGGVGTRIFTIKSRRSTIGPEMTQPSLSFSVDSSWVCTFTTRTSSLPCVFTLPSLCSVFDPVQVHPSSEYTGVR